ncbi:MAG: hypothetical protein N2316_00580 [Spirochaetes bacterium]|nr:hypothetical protein [Spirochaetota bacterium]
MGYEKVIALVEEIGAIMKDFAKGNIPLSVAEEAYERLSGECERLESDLENPFSPHLVQGILYHHNVKNCCIHSGLYVRNNNSIHPMCAIGEAQIAKKISEVLTKQKISENSTVYRIGGEIMQFPSHTLYAVKIGTDARSPIFGALTSSTHFAEEVFLYTAHFLSILLKIEVGTVQHYNYFSEIKKQVSEFLGENLSLNRDINIAVFIFRNIEKIFSHMGFRILLDVAATIKKTIQDSFGTNTLCVYPSLRLFVAFTPLLPHREEEIRKKKIEFYYQGLAIPFQRINLPLRIVDAKERIWYDIFHFEDYVCRGDVHR